MKPRLPIKDSVITGKANNILEEMLGHQSVLNLRIIQKIQEDKNRKLTRYQELCRTITANVSHFLCGCIHLIQKCNFPNEIGQTTQLNLPTDMLKTIVGLIRPIFEAISTLKFIEKFSSELYPDSLDSQDEVRNEIAENLHVLALYSAEFERKKQKIFDQPVRKRNEKIEEYKKMYEILDEDMSSLSAKITEIIGKDRSKYQKGKNNPNPKDCIQLVKDSFRDKGLKFESKDPFSHAWVDDDREKLSNEMYSNLIADKLENPWNGDPDVYENEIAPQIALGYFSRQFESEALHFSPKFIFQEVPSKIVNFLNLWRVICLVLPLINNELIKINCSAFKIETKKEFPEYDFDIEANKLGIWAASISPLIIKKIMKGY